MSDEQAANACCKCAAYKEIIKEQAEAIIDAATKPLHVEIERLRSELDDTERSRKLHTGINRRAHKALGGTEEGEGSSWHDIPERISGLKQQLADARASEKDSRAMYLTADRTAQDLRQRLEKAERDLTTEMAAHKYGAPHWKMVAEEQRGRIRELEKEAERERDELRVELEKALAANKLWGEQAAVTGRRTAELEAEVAALKYHNPGSSILETSSLADFHKERAEKAERERDAIRVRFDKACDDSSRAWAVRNNAMNELRDENAALKRDRDDSLAVRRQCDDEIATLKEALKIAEERNGKLRDFHACYDLDAGGFVRFHPNVPPAHVTDKWLAARVPQ
jgi:predicted RNA-binding protein YlxR (DUF448 family)